MSDQRSGLGRAIRMRRAELDLKRRDLAERAGLSYPYISEIENGVKEPSAKALRHIAEALELGVAELAVLIDRVDDSSTDGPSILLEDSRPGPQSRAPHTPPTRQSDGLELADSPAELMQMAAAAGLRATRPNGGVLPEEMIRQVVREEIARWETERLPTIVQHELQRLMAALIEPKPPPP